VALGPVDKAVWYIESHYREAVTLDVLAAVAGVSRFHLSRAFGYAVGVPITRYLRLRRLSLAAMALAEGHEDILELALSLGYGSHEAFTRAFKGFIGTTPERVRRQGHVCNLPLMEARRMDETIIEGGQVPRVVAGEQLLLAGLARRYGFASGAEIPGQWQDFGGWIGRIPGQQSEVAYGVIFNGGDEGYDYLCAVQVADRATLPAEFTRLRIPRQTYAVFEHDGHVSGIRATCNSIWSQWLPASGHEVADGPWFERYPERFEPHTGLGGLEVWIPIRP
jgi:AraC family transcriptional regulator